ncbi:hypothetical protein [Aquibacillus kalidii]|uniref:hypothetical protein n=1 Tax=Aquibacillus kalidii TaxID=2762597 RepID=UPI001649147C|nr:hypothetical protein [Aquibacillus kalidii]
MRRLIMNLLFIALGALLISTVLVIEIDGILGWFLTTLGVFLIGVGLTLKYIIKLFANIF